MVSLMRRAGERKRFYLWWHIVERVEGWVDVRHEELRRQRRQESLGVRSEVRRNLCALPNADVLQEAEYQDR